MFFNDIIIILGVPTAAVFRILLIEYCLTCTTYRFIQL